jgi:hypothetical protein
VTAAILLASLLLLAVPGRAAEPLSAEQIDFGMEVMAVSPRAAGRALYILEATTPARGRRMLHLWDLAQRRVVRTYDQVPLNIVDFAEVNGKLCVATDVVAIVDPETGKLEHTVPMERRDQPLVPSRILPSAPRGKVLVVASPISRGSRPDSRNPATSTAGSRSPGVTAAGACVLELDLKKGTALPLFLQPLDRMLVSKGRVLIQSRGRLEYRELEDLRRDQGQEGRGQPFAPDGDRRFAAVVWSNVLQPGGGRTLVAEAEQQVFGFDLQGKHTLFMMPARLITVHPVRNQILIARLPGAESSFLSWLRTPRKLALIDARTGQEEQAIELRAPGIAWQQSWDRTAVFIVPAKGGDRLVFSPGDSLWSNQGQPWFEVTLP